MGWNCDYPNTFVSPFLLHFPISRVWKPCWGITCTGIFYSGNQKPKQPARIKGTPPSSRTAPTMLLRVCDVLHQAWLILDRGKKPLQVAKVSSWIRSAHYHRWKGGVSNCLLPDKTPGGTLVYKFALDRVTRMSPRSGRAEARKAFSSSHKALARQVWLGDWFLSL